MSNSGISPQQLAVDLGQLQDDDIRYLASELWDLHEDWIPTWVAVEIRDILSPNGERTAPAPLYWPLHTWPAGDVGRAFQTATGYAEPCWFLLDEETQHGPSDT